VNFATRCPRRDECKQNSDCAAGRVCVKNGACCRTDKLNVCMKVC
jgi:hypothetical protein